MNLSRIFNLRLRFLLVAAALLSPAIAQSAQWGTFPNFPAGPTDGCSSFVINGVAYVVGGLAQNRLYQLNAASGAWQNIAPLPGNKHRVWSFAFAYNGKGYLGGGDTTGGFTVTDEFFEFDPATKAWSQKAPFGGGPRDGSAAFVLGDKAYIGGGFDGTYIQSDFWEYDFKTDRWSLVGVLPSGATIFPSTFVIGGKGYMVGGAGASEMNGLYEFDPATSTWRRREPFPGTARQAGFSFVLNDKGYYGGGMTGYTTTFADIWSYDPLLDTWNRSADYPHTHSAWSVAFVVAGQAFIGTGAGFGGTGITFAGQFFSFTESSSGVSDRDGSHRVEPMSLH